MDDVIPTSTADHITLAADIVSAYVSNNSIPTAELASLIASVHGALVGLSGAQAAPSEPELEKPSSTQIRKSVHPDGIVSFIDGKTYKSMKRHLSRHGFEPSTYRERFGLPKDYPMVSAAYSAARSELAKNLGLGQQRRKRAAAAAAAPEPAVAEPKRRGRGKAKTAMAAE